MKTHRYLEPSGFKVYDIPPSQDDGPERYWKAINNVPCPRKPCTGTIRETRYHKQGITGYCLCDGCGQHFLAGGNGNAPTLVEVPEQMGMNALKQLIKQIRTRYQEDTQGTNTRLKLAALSTSQGSNPPHAENSSGGEPEGKPGL